MDGPCVLICCKKGHSLFIQMRDRGSGMMEPLRCLAAALLYLQIYLHLMSGERIISEAGKKVSLLCTISGAITWTKNGNKAPGQTSNKFEMNSVRLEDAGTYTCKSKAATKTFRLLVFQVVPTRYLNLLVSESLRLEMKTSSGMSPLRWTSRHVNTTGSVLTVDRVELKHNGQFRCHVKMDDGEEKVFDTEITVKGFMQSRSIVYTSGKSPVSIPWIFNFAVRKTPLERDPKVLRGQITYPSRNVRNLTVFMAKPCWNKNCEFPDSNEKSLSLGLPKPEIGDYLLEIVLNLEGRRKTLHKEVCVANLTVSTSESIIRMETNVTLQCNINCLDEKAQLCWFHTNLNKEICGPPGQRTLTTNVMVLSKEPGDWTCSVIIDQAKMVSTTLTLVVTPEFFNVHNPMFWVVMSAGVLVILVIVAIVSVLTARCRRVQRARYRRWLLESVQQQRVCECHGFAPKRLKDHI